MLYRINRYYNTEQEHSYFLLECQYSETEMISLIATLQHYTEELFGDPDIFLNSDCLIHILCDFFHVNNVKADYKNTDFYISATANPRLAGSMNPADSGQKIILINRYLAKNSLNPMECQENINLWISQNPDKEKDLRELIFKEGIE